MAETKPVAAEPADRGPLESPTVLHELQRVRAIFDTARAVAQALEAQLMESLWTIRREIGDDQARFELLIGSHTDVDPRRAWLMAETWDNARRNRNLRTLASQQPSHALALVTQFIEAGLGERLQTLCDDDREVAELVSKPPRKFMAAVRDLVAKGKSAQEGRHPADREEIAALKAERDSAVAELEQARKVIQYPGGDMRQALDDLRGVECRLAEVAERLATLLSTASGFARNEAVQLLDVISRTVDDLSDQAEDGLEEEA